MEDKPFISDLKSIVSITLIFSYFDNFIKVKRLLKRLSKKGKCFFENNVDQLKYFCSHSRQNIVLSGSQLNGIYLSESFKYVHELNIKLTKYFPIHLMNLRQIQRINKLSLSIDFSAFYPFIDTTEILKELAEKANIVTIYCDSKVTRYKLECLLKVFEQISNQVIEIYEFGSFDQECLDVISSLPHLQTLQLKGDNIAKIECISNAICKQRLINLTQFSFKDRLIKQEFSKALQNIMRSLKVLKFHELIEFDLSTIEMFPYMEELKLPVTKLDFEILNKFPNLNSLHLEFQEIHGNQNQIPACISKIKIFILKSMYELVEINWIFLELKSLSVCQLKFIKIPWDIFSQISLSLTNLSLSDCFKFDQQSVNFLNQFRFLRILKLKNLTKSSKLEEIVMKEQGYISNNYSIEKLEISFDNFEIFFSNKREVVPFFAYLKNVKALRKLRLQQTVRQFTQTQLFYAFFQHLMAEHPFLQLNIQEIYVSIESISHILICHPNYLQALNIGIQDYKDLELLEKGLEMNVSIFSLKIHLGSIFFEEILKKVLLRLQKHPKLQKLEVTLSTSMFSILNKKITMSKLILEYSQNLEAIAMFNSYECELRENCNWLVFHINEELVWKVEKLSPNELFILF